ncbi:hypothetical protein SAMN04487996_104296 [Dyadobacter soli]|uniref:Uncharacterized protein n=1 Tax=Dyadobacter soli TaxID=659014 RepID=A0A1G7BSQ9_9BACT|nr:hypothetical protein [Dyadobacter soli]SDE29992.1 hypothetical protein SAMN04487996_104296 [Dyadobacter soli]
MRTEKWLVSCIALLLIQLVACERGKMEENAPAPVSARTGADSAKLDSIPWDTIRTDSSGKDSIWKDTIWRDSIPQDTIVRDTTIADSSFSDTLGARQRSAIPRALARLKTIH